MDARVRETHEVVLEEGLRLLLSEGTGAVTHARISAATGVARTTIYRHWATRADLLSASFMRGRPEVPVPMSGDIETDLVSYLKATRDSLWSSPVASVVVAIYDQMDGDPELTAAYRQIRDLVRADLISLLEGGIESRDIVTDLEIADLLALLLGPIFYERLLGHSRASDRLIEAMVASLMPPPV